MDVQTYEAFHDRLAYLESLLAPSWDATPVLKQLEQLNGRIGEAADQHFVNMFDLLQAKGLWHRLPTLKSQATDGDGEAVEDCRNVLVAAYGRFMEFLQTLEEVIRLAEDADRAVRNSSNGYKDVLEESLPTATYNRVVDTYSVLLVRSIALLERTFEFMMQQNELWASVELRLVELERELNVSEREKRSKLQYT